MSILDSIQKVDQSFFLFLNSFNTEFWDNAMVIMTGKAIWFPFYALLIFFIIRKYKRNSVYIFFFLIVAIVFSDQVAGIMKNLTQRLRPTHDPALSNLVHSLANKGGLYSFFSSHAANTFAVAALTSFLFNNKPYTLLIFIWACLVSYTRIYLGLHFPFDILVGCIWGYLMGFAAHRAIIWVQQKYFKSMFPDISKTKLSNEESVSIILFFIIYMTAVLLTIQQLGANQLLL
jgi:undecaprenyl-diphosphatase